MRVGVIGAGVTGLTAAYELSKKGHHVIVYERTPFLGGQASTFDVGGGRLERGYHHLFTSDTDIVDLMGEIGLGDKMRWYDSKVGTLYDGKTYNFVTPMDLLKFKPLSILSRIRLGLSTLAIRGIKDWKSLETETAAEWLRRKAGQEAYDIFWEPMLRGKFGDEYFQEIGMPWVWGKIATRFASRGKGLSKEMLGYPVGSFGEIFDCLVDRIREHGNLVCTGTEVTKISTSNGCLDGLEVKLVDQGTTHQEKFDAVIATTQSFIFARKLLPELPEEYVAKFERTRYLSAVLLILVLNRPLSHIYWLNVADRSIPFVGVIEHTNMVPTELYGGKHIVYLTNYLTRENPLYRLNKNQLLKEYLPHLRHINQNFDPSWIEESYLHHVDAAQPIIGTHYSQLLPEHKMPIKGVYLANTTQVYPEDRGTNYSVRMGRKVALMLDSEHSPA